MKKSYSNNAHQQSVFYSMISGAGGGAMASVATCPLDVVKVRMQVQKRVKGVYSHGYSGTINSIGKILSEEGFRGCYRGLGTILMALIPNYSIYWATYSSAKNFFYSHTNLEGAPLHMITAVIGGVTTDLCMTPMWTAKIRLQTQRLLGEVPKYNSTVHTLITMVREEGLRSVYKGLTPQLMGNGTTLAIQFPLYERFKYEFREHNIRNGISHGHLTAWQLVFSSVSARIAAMFVSYPLEVMRSNLQHSTVAMGEGYRLRRLIDKTWRTEGMAGFYKGMLTNMVRVVPSTGITFLTYETLQYWLGNSS